MNNSKKTRPARLAKKVAREYDAMVRGIQSLEHALASPAPTREGAWRQQARRDLANVVGLLQEHCESAENEGGLLLEVERGLGRPRGLSEARREHQRLSREAVALLAAIDSDRKAARLTYREVRQRGWDLIARLRRHQAREADLLIELLERDTGALD